MDTLSHALWGGVAFGRKSRKSFLLASTFGLSPDILSFGILFASTLLGIGEQPSFKNGPPDPSLIPQYVDFLYNATHSLIIFFVVFSIVWFFLKKPLWEMGAWFFHIALDIFTHSFEFFPTPFLWPLFDYKFNGVSWGTAWVFFLNVALLFISYLYFFIYKKENLKKCYINLFLD